MLIFFVILAVLMIILFGTSYWLTGFVWESSGRNRVRTLLLVLDGLMLGGLFIGPRFLRDVPWGGTAIAFFSIILMTQFFFAVLVLGALGIRRIRRLLSSKTPVDYERRRLILGHAMIYPLISFAAGTYGGVWERNETVVNSYDIPVKALPKSFQGLTIAQISDVHLGMFFSLDRLRDLLTQAAELKPDVLAITGDIFDNAQMTPEAVRIVDSFVEAFPKGIWYCHGNHEHHRGIALVESCLDGTRIHVLVNRSETVLDKERPLVFVGVDYPMGVMGEAFQEKKKAFMDQAMEGVQGNAVCVLLAHHPEYIDNAAEYGVALTLTGHTHGGQVGIFGVPIFPIFKYTRGMVKIGDCLGYVHVGNGSWFPYRFGCPPEIAFFRLKDSGNHE